MLGTFYILNEEQQAAINVVNETRINNLLIMVALQDYVVVKLYDLQLAINANYLEAIGGIDESKIIELEIPAPF